MQAVTNYPRTGKSVWPSRIVTGFVSLFLLLDGAMKLFKPAPVVEATTKLGYPVALIVPIGVILLACLAAYLIPRTAVLGAILLTGYLGGAVSATLRMQDGLFSPLFAVITGALVWLGLYLRDDRLKELIPLRK